MARSALVVPPRGSPVDELLHRFVCKISPFCPRGVRRAADGCWRPNRRVSNERGQDEYRMMEAAFTARSSR